MEISIVDDEKYCQSMSRFFLKVLIKVLSFVSYLFRKMMLPWNGLGYVVMGLRNQYFR